MRMKPYLMFAIAMIVLCGTVLAQEAAPKVEVFGGYSYLRTSGNTKVSGWNGQVAFNLNKYAGIAADFGSFYQFQAQNLTQSVVPPFPTLRARAQLNTYLFGPVVSDRVGKITGFAHFLVGGAHAETGFQFYGNGAPWTATYLAFAAGGGIDANVGENFAVRLFQIDYIRVSATDPQPTTVSPQVTYIQRGRNNLRLSFGVVFKIK